MRSVQIKEMFKRIIQIMGIGACLFLVGCEKTAVDFFSRGNAHSNKGQYDQAIADFSKAVEINPRFAEAYYNRGNAYRAKREYKEAILNYTKAIEINPTNDMAAYQNRGHIYIVIGEYDRAISDFNKAIEINPRLAEPYNNRGCANRFKAEYNYLRKLPYRDSVRRAIMDFNKALEIRPSYPEAYYNRAIAYYLEGEYNKAWADVHRAQSMGCTGELKFLKDLRSASGREN